MRLSPAALVSVSVAENDEGGGDGDDSNRNGGNKQYITTVNGRRSSGRFSRNSMSRSSSCGSNTSDSNHKTNSSSNRDHNDNHNYYCNSIVNIKPVLFTSWEAVGRGERRQDKEGEGKRSKKSNKVERRKAVDWRSGDGITLKTVILSLSVLYFLCLSSCLFVCLPV